METKPIHLSKTIWAIVAAIVVTTAKNKGIDLPFNVNPEIQDKTLEILQIASLVFAGLSRLVSKKQIKL